ncbi:hypothetical protein BC941DRAFT_474061 [Chlamydoabsidia padenii]|nr:hypothetical protein BC941DRAFT_474061 [Chlamydoabsidia padenii]
MQPSLITLNDAITDSPVYRANIHHFDEQLDLLEKWLDALSKHLKLYCERLNKFNLETNLVCKKAIPVGIDNALVDPHFTGAVIKSFSDALQTSLAFKTKLVSDLEDNFIQPLQQFVKVQLKEFKDFRKQHEKALERYEAQLTKYSSQSNTKEVSALREEAFRLHEARKCYVHMSGQHVVRLLQFRSALEHTLVEQFSAATLAHLNDFDGGMNVWQKLDTHLASWKQWLVDDKSTCNYQLLKLQNTRKELENEFINQTQPPRDLDRYAPSAFNSMLHSPMAKHFSMDLMEKSTSDQQQQQQQQHKAHQKWGYLFTRGTRGYWTRRWFFLYDGYFGSCLVNASPKLKGAISLDERVSVLLSEIKPIADIDRRYCFEVVCIQKSPIVLQAETEDEMKDWISAFDKAKRLAIQNEQLPSRIATTPAAVDEHNNEPSESHELNKRSYSHVDASTSFISDNTTKSSHEQSTSKPSNSEPIIHHDSQPTIVLLSTSADNDRVSLANSTSLTPLLVWEAARAPTTQPGSSHFMPSASSPLHPLMLDNDSKHQDNNNSNKGQSNSGDAFNNVNSNGIRLPPKRPLNISLASDKSSGTATNTGWGIPWTLVPSMFQSSGDNNDPPPTPSVVPPTPLIGDVDGHQVIWPTNLDGNAVPKIELVDYSAELERRNQELRTLFGGVAAHEVVLDAFICSLKKPPNSSNRDKNTSKEEDDLNWPTSPIGSGSPLEQMEQELQHQLTQNVKPPTSEFGYSYTGRAFVTQETFWLYSCVMMTCVHTVAVRLKDINNIRLVRDPSITNTGKQSNIALAIDLKQDDISPKREPLMLVTLMDDIEVVAEKLRIAVDNAKCPEPGPLQTMYDILHHMSAVMSKKKNTAITTIIKSEPVKAHSSPDLMQRPRSNSSGDIHGMEPASSPIPSSSASSRLERMRRKKGGKNTNGSSGTDNKHHPKSGALAAAMMAATVAGGGSFFDVSKMNEVDLMANNGDNSKHVSRKHNISDPPHPTGSFNKITKDTKTEENMTKPDSGPDSSTIEDDLPSHIQAPAGPINCNCNDHLEKMEYEMDLPISAKRLYEVLFSEESTGAAANGGILNQKIIASGSRDLSVSAWSDVDGKQQRILKYIMPVNNPMVKVKEAEVVETQIVLKKEDYMRYVIQISTKCAQLPYADAFIPSIRYCISWVSPTQSKLSICMGVKFVKNILVKSMVMKAALKGMGESITQFTPMIVDLCDKLNGGPRKDMSTGNNLGDGQTGEAKTANATTSTTSMTNKQPETKKQDNEGWYGQLLDIWEVVEDLLPFPTVSLLVGLLALWLLWVWLRSGSNKQHGLYKQTADRQVISRAVYLRDVEDGLINYNTTIQQVSYMDPYCYQLYLQSKSDNINNTTSNTMDLWFSPKHYTFAVELLFSRERLAILRHDTLVIFQLLNQVDAQLSENEYVNWLLDGRLECHSAVTMDNASKCEAIYHQLQSLNTPPSSYT